VIEVDRPDRTTRRRQGESDPIDAIAAARAVLAGTATGAPRTSPIRSATCRRSRPVTRAPAGTSPNCSGVRPP
jgi:transposase